MKAVVKALKWNAGIASLRRPILSNHFGYVKFAELLVGMTVDVNLNPVDKKGNPLCYFDLPTAEISYKLPHHTLNTKPDTFFVELEDLETIND
jgi:hypothetical protein